MSYPCDLFFARRAGVTIAHNLTESEVYELRLRPDAHKVTVYVQHSAHRNCHPAFCPDCAENAATQEWEEHEKRMQQIARGM